MKRFAILLSIFAGAMTAFGALMDQTVNESDARLVRLKGDPQLAGSDLTRIWPAVAADASSGYTVKELAENLNDVSIYTNPLANKHTYTGTWVNISTEAIDENTAGTAARVPVIIQRLHKVDTPTSASSLDAIPSRISEDNEILDLFQIQEGEGDTRSLMWENLPPGNEGAGTTFQDLMYNITDAQMVSQFASGWVYWRREWQDTKDGIGQFMVAFKKAVWANSAGTSPDKVLDQSFNYQRINYDPGTGIAGWSRRSVDGGDGIPIADLAQIGSNQTAGAGWVLDSVSVSDNGDGSGSVRTTKTKERDTTNYVYRSWKASNGRREENEVVIWSNLSSDNATLIYLDAKTNSTSMTNATYATSPSSHKLASVDQVPNANGSYDVNRTTFIPKYGGSAAKSSDWENYTNSTTYIVTKYRSVRTNGKSVDQKRLFTRTDNDIQCETADKAYEHINSFADKIHVIKRYPGTGKYRFTAVTESLGSWTDE